MGFQPRCLALEKMVEGLDLHRLAECGTIRSRVVNSDEILKLQTRYEDCDLVNCGNG